MIQPISVFNQSSLVSTAELTACMAAINNVSMPAFARAWGGLQAELMFDKPNGAWAMWILDRTTVANDLAFHVNQVGVPVIQVFAQTIRDAGASLCQDMDHETKETLVDPTAATIVPYPGGNIVKEVCDPVSEGALDLGGGLSGANFVYPSWFVAGSAGPWDERRDCTRPGEIRPGGYVEQSINGQWQLTAMRGPSGHSWRINYPGRLAYRARNRAP